MALQTFAAVIRARVGIKLVAEMLWMTGDDRLTVEGFIEHCEEYAAYCAFKEFCQEWFSDCIVTAEMKF